MGRVPSGFDRIGPSSRGFVVEYASMSFLLNPMESEPILSNRHHSRESQQTLDHTRLVEPPGELIFLKA